MNYMKESVFDFPVTEPNKYICVEGLWTSTTKAVNMTI